jgi:hypothetical protein
VLAGASHRHQILLGAVQSVTQVLGAGQHTIALPCEPGQVAVTPGFRFLSPATGFLAGSERTATGWRFTVQVTRPGRVELSDRCLGVRLTNAAGHTHELEFTEQSLTTSVPAGATVQPQVSCADDASGIVATWQLPSGMRLLGDEPQAKTRVFTLLNPTGAPLTGTIDVVCLGNRTGPGIAPGGVTVNTATVSSSTPDPDLANNRSTVTVDITRAPRG